MEQFRITALLALAACVIGSWVSSAYAEDPPATITALGSSQLIRVVPRHQLAIVIDDLGYNQARDNRALALPAALTVAVLPQSPWAHTIASQASAAGKEVILHQPMQTLSGLHQRGPGDLHLGMSSPEIVATLLRNLQAVPGSVGINNHRGSLLTAEEGVMDQLMQALQGRGLYFLDSRTTAQTVAYRRARQWGIPTLKRDVFLDHVRTASAIDQQFKRAIKVARTQGYAVMIAHPHQESLSYLAAALLALPADIQTTTLSDLIPKLATAAP